MGAAREGREMLRVLIVEDEREAAENLVGLLHRYESARSERFEIQIRNSSLDLFGDHRHYDICLFDIDLPGISGMEAAHLMRSYDTQTAIIFVTNLARFAVRGYEVNACGFIVKPATLSSLALCLDRAVRQARTSRGTSLLATVDESTFVVPVAELAWAEVRTHDLIYHVVNRDPIKTRGSLSELKQRLEDAPFFAVSRSVLVNLDFVSHISGDEATLTTGEKIHLSRGKKKPLGEALAKHIGGGL